jgi:hypothetical protein
VYARILDQPECKLILQQVKDRDTKIDADLVRREGIFFLPSPLFFSCFYSFIPKYSALRVGQEGVIFLRSFFIPHSPRIFPVVPVFFRFSLLFSSFLLIQLTCLLVFPLLTRLLHVASHLQLLEPHAKDKQARKREKKFYDLVLVRFSAESESRNLKIPSSEFRILNKTDGRFRRMIKGKSRPRSGNPE